MNFLESISLDLSLIIGFIVVIISLLIWFYLRYEKKIEEHKKELIQKNQELLIYTKDFEFINTKLNELIEKNETYLKNINSLENENIDLKIQNSTLLSNIELEKQHHSKLKLEFEEQSKKLELKLNEIMQNSLENKLKKFDETSIKSLDLILKPFKENIESFKKRVEDSQENSTKKFAELSKEIELVAKAGFNISQEAQNLTKALKGKKQTQGSWGEMILESVLEYSGLLKNIHYFTQQSYKDEDGDTKRPDVIIKLPQNRSIIIDSKVSLNDYEEYIRAQTEEEKAICLNNIVSSFKNHINGLDSKDYAHYQSGTLQYVFMFIPIEGAFSLAVQKDPSLYEYALKKHIAIVNPSTLTVSLRTIYLYWQSEQSSTLATKLFDEAGKLYDKMVSYAENFGKIGNQIKTLSNSYEIASKQLSEGTGNILSRTENLKKLGAKTTKTLKNSKVEFDDFNENEAEILILEEIKSKS